MALWEIMGRCFQGMLFLRCGKQAKGLKLLHIAINDLREAGYALYHTASLAELADAPGRMGETGRALTVIDEALMQSARNDERWCRAELLRVKAETLLLQNSPQLEALAEDHLQQSLDCARQCEALAWELKTANSLC